MRLTRRSLAFGAAAGFTSLTTLLASPSAQASDAKRQCLTVLYPSTPDAKFDFEYYRDKHLAMLRAGYGASIGRMEVRKGLNRTDGSAVAFIATLTVEILDMAAFGAAGKELLPKLRADIANYTNIIPVAQIEEIL